MADTLNEPPKAPDAPTRRPPHIGMDREPFSFTKWVPAFALRFVLWTAGVIGTVRGYVWVLGLDDEYKAWSAANRAELLLILVLGSIMYGIADWMRSNEP